MAFEFSLSVLLRLRENLEHKELLVLEKHYANIARIQARLLEAEQNILHAQERRQEELSHGTLAAEVKFTVDEERRIREYRETLLQELLEAQKRLKEQLVIYWKARQKRDVLQELRKHQFDAYRSEQAKIEQRDRDELFLLRLRRKR